MSPVELVGIIGTVLRDLERLLGARRKGSKDLRFVGVRIHVLLIDLLVVVILLLRGLRILRHDQPGRHQLRVRLVHRVYV